MRKTGILLPVSSLPSPYGVGTLGKAAFHFIDFLSAAGQSLWQVLPHGPTGYGDSPYQSFSAMAGNPYYIDLDILAGNGLLKQEEIGKDWGKNKNKVDYGLLFEKRFKILAKATARQNKTDPEYLKFCRENAYWLDDYAMFMAIKESHEQAGFSSWPAPLRKRDPIAMKEAEAQWGPRIEFWRCVQFFFFEQWKAVKIYANAQGIEIIGDIPIYVSPDSSELWAHPELFQLDNKGRLEAVAGVPPDGFSADGQLWGNPLYNWSYHKHTRYAWWIQRMKFMNQMYDLTRIDHFRGFSGYYAVPATAKTAAKGRWMKGPGKDFIKALKKALPDMQVIAEDLGFLTEEVYELLSYSGYPGMKVLQFAFDSREESDYLPHNYPRHTVVYTGTHDNTTTEDWSHLALKRDVKFARKYMGLSSRQSIAGGMIRAAMSSVAETAVIPMQDWLRLGADARFNTPSTLGGNNWRWRLVPGQLDIDIASEIREKTRIFGRLSRREKDKAKLAKLILEQSVVYEHILPSAITKSKEKEFAMKNSGRTEKQESEENIPTGKTPEEKKEWAKPAEKGNKSKPNKDKKGSRKKDS